MITLEESMSIQIMYKQGYSKKRIARELGISINTVRKYIELDTKPCYQRQVLKPLKLDPYRYYIKDRLASAEPHWVPATVIYREILNQGYSGKLSTLRAYMRQLKPSIKEEDVQRFETPPGKQMQVDWAVLRRGKHRLSAFVATLGYSRMSYVKFVTNEKLTTLLDCHEQAFDYFGGVPEQIIYDNMKTVVVTRDCYGKGKHRLQAGFWDFSKHHGFIPKVCRPYRPQTKGKVERFIHYLRHSFYYPLLGELKHSKNETINIATANEKVLRWLNEVANQRCHGTTGKVPAVEWRDELLSPMSQPYQGVQPDKTTKKSLWQCNSSPVQRDLATYDQFSGEVI